MTEPSPDPEQGQHSRPEPVLQAASVAGNIAGLIGGLATALTSYAAITHQSWSISAAAFLMAVSASLSKILPRVTALGARAQVTPLAKPFGMDGVPLVPDRTPEN